MASFSEATTSPNFLPNAPDMAPLAVCANHPVAATISSIVAPSGARSSSISIACFVPARNVGTLGAGASATSSWISTSVLATTGSIPITNRPASVTTGDGHGTTLVVTDAGLLAIGIEPVVVKTIAINKHDAEAPAPKVPTPHAGTKQAMLIALLQAPDGATMGEIVVATGWLAHTARGAMSGALGKKLGLVVTSAKEEDRGRVYRIGRNDPV